MRSLALAAVLAVCPQVLAVDYAVTEPDSTQALPPALNFIMKTLDGSEEVNLAEKYEGKVVLLVNVASRCGLTPQYTALESLHEKYGEAGLAVVGVPCNQFNGQEPGTAEQIADFCSTTYGVKFDMLEKSNVKQGEPDQCELYKYLTSEETNPEFHGEIGWNFEKFLINRRGEVINRFSPRVTPDSPEVIQAIEAELKAAE